MGRVQKVEAVADNPENKHANERPLDAPLTSCQTSAAHDHGGNGGELEAYLLAFGSAEATRAASTAPARPAIAPLSVNSTNSTRRMDTPKSAEARRSPPTAYR